MKSFLPILLSLYLLFLVSINAIGQNYEYRAPIPPTPEAASLAKFAQVPVSYSTGLPNVSIPLYEIKLRDMTLPISLNYHAGGIRVDEIASSVGLGWSLSAGGSISSTVFDKPDFELHGYATGDSAGFFPQDREIVPHSGFLPLHQEPLDPERLADYYLVTGLIGMGLTTQNQTMAYDTQPDLFYYSFAGRSGKFFHTRKGKAHTIPFEPLLITNQEGSQHFSIKDEQGITYVFSDRETSVTHYTTYGHKAGPQSGGDYVPATKVNYLSLIHTLSGDTIWFEYEPISYSYRNQVSYTRYLRNPGQFCNTNFDTRTESLTEVTGGLRIKSIRSNLGHLVNFKYAPCDRSDLPGTFALQEVEVKALGTERRKVFQLTHDYFYSDELAAKVLDDCTITSTAPEMLRLKLTAVQEVGAPPYRIAYDESVRLPSRMSPAQDHWGFYNGTSTLLPIDIFWGFLDGGTREPSAELMGAWSIKSLTYPTGGYTNFEFEPHEAYRSRVEVQSIPRYFAYYNSDYPPSPDVISKDTIFEVGSGVTIYGITARFEVSDATLSLPDFFRAEIRGISDPSYSRLFTKKSALEGERLQLLPGIYKLIIESKGSFDDAFVRLDWHETQQHTVSGNQLAGGQRVAKITDHALEGEPMIREFTYKSLAEPTHSSGRILYYPEYISQSSAWIGLAPDGTVPHYDEFCNYTVQSSRSTSPLSTLSGSSVAYTSVGVMSSAQGQKKFSTYKYSMEPDYTPHAGPPFTPPTSMEWARGLLLEETDYLYDMDNNSFLPLRKKTSTYSRNYTPPGVGGESGNYYLPIGKNEAHALGLQIFVVRPPYRTTLGSCDACVMAADFRIESYRQVSVWQFLSRVEERVFDSGDTSKYVATTSYFLYDNPRHAQMTRLRSVDSKGVMKTSSMTYPWDYITPVSPSVIPAGYAALALKALADNHDLKKVVESQEWTGSSSDSLLVSSTLSVYRPFASYAVLDKVLKVEIAQPWNSFSIASLNMDGVLFYDPRYKEEFRFGEYSGRLNPLEFSNKGMLTSLVWDEEVNQVTAEVKGAALNQIAYTSFETALGQNGGWTVTGTSAESAGAKTGRWYFTGTATTSGEASLGDGVYEVSLWARGGGTVVVNGQALAVPADWERLSLRLENPGQVTVSCSGGTKMDELRLHPVEAQMTTYTYDPLVGVTSVTDPNGRTIYYEYDGFGRLQAVRDQEGNVVRSHEYHYAGQ